MAEEAVVSEEMPNHPQTHKAGPHHLPVEAAGYWLQDFSQTLTAQTHFHHAPCHAPMSIEIKRYSGSATAIGTMLKNLL